MKEKYPYLPSEMGMITLMWELAENPSQVVGYYVGFITMATLNRKVNVLNELQENISPVAGSIGYNGWPEASMLLKFIEQNKTQLIRQKA